ncbi:unnamed protein product [Aphanomyces euteiches]
MEQELFGNGEQLDVFDQSNSISGGDFNNSQTGALDQPGQMTNDEFTFDQEDSAFSGGGWSKSAALALPPLPEPVEVKKAKTHKQTMSRADMIKLAKQKAMSERLGGGKSFFKVTMKDIADLGTGIHLYFDFTKSMGITFGIMSILAIPTIVMNATGHGFETDQIDPLRFCTLSIANLGVNSTMNATDYCLGNPFTQNPNYVSYIITAFDLLFSLAFAIFILFFRNKIRSAVAAQGESVTPAKYAVFVRGLPRWATEELILAHFNSLYDPTVPRHEYPMYLGCWGKRREVKERPNLTRGGNLSKRVKNLDHANDNKLYKDKWIAQISIARPTGGLLRTFLAMEYLTAKVAELQDILDTYKGRTMDKVAEQAIPRIEKQLTKVQEKLEKKTSKLKALRKKGGSAALHQCGNVFVVFNSLESQKRCVHDYRTSSRWYARYFQPKALRFQGKHRLHIVPAPEPSDIIWENLELSDRERRFRRYFTNFIAFLLLLLSCGIISLAQSAQQSFAKQVIPNFCSEAVPAVFAGDYNSIDNYTWALGWNPNPTGEVCPAQSYYITYYNGIRSNVTGSNPCLDPCISTSSSVDRNCSTLPCYRPEFLTAKTRPCASYMQSDMLQCYCEPKLALAIKLFGIIQGPKKMFQAELPCEGYLTNYLRKNGAIVLAASVVIIVNVFLTTILRAFGEFERHTSESELASALVIKLFFAQFLNTGVIVLLVNANWTKVPLPLSLDEILHGQFDDFVQQWYVAVGVGISTTMMVNAVAPQVVPFLMTFVINPISQCLGKRSAITQKQLDEVYAGPPFDISLRYPLVLNTVFVTMIYCGGLPILLPLASLGCLITHLFDKLTLMRLFSIRTAYDEALGQLAYSMLPFALLLHLGFSTWMYGNSQFLQSNLIDVAWMLGKLGISNADEVSDVNALFEDFKDLLAKYDPFGQFGLLSKVFRVNVFPIFLVFVLTAVALFLSTFFGSLLWPLFDKTVGLVLRVVSFAGSSALSGIYKKIFCRRKLSPDTTISTIPQYPDFAGPFQMPTDPSVKVDASKGYETIEGGQILIRRWLVETPDRSTGDQMLTWEALNGPVKTYSIVANPKYKNAFAEMENAAKRHQSVAKSATNASVKKASLVVPTS